MYIYIFDIYFITVSYQGQMAVGKIRIYVDLRDHVILCAQCAKSAFIIGLDRSVRCPITVDFSG